MNTSIQKRISYSPLQEDSFYSRSSNSFSSDLTNCTLILPRFLTLSQELKESTQSTESILSTSVSERENDFCYGKQREVVRVANWDDIHHELFYFHSSPFSQHSLQDQLLSQEWYFQFYHEFTNGKNLHRILPYLSSQYVSEYTVYEWVQNSNIPLEMYSSLLSLLHFYSSFFQKHSSINILDYQ